MRSLLSLCLAATGVCAYADEYDPPAEPLSLKPSTELTTRLAKDQKGDVPTFIEADRINGHIDAEMIAEGRVILRNLREKIESDWLRYDKPEDRVRAYGNVVMDQYRDHIEGGRLDLLMSDRIGQMKSARYEIYGDGVMPSRGTADTLHFKGENIYQLDNSIYTTCPLDKPDWVMKSDSMELNYVTSLGTGRQVHVEYKGVPILYTPWMDFSLDNKRKSGFLTPSFGAGKVNGTDISVPWYWNIAPDQDATITPRYMQSRGLQLSGEYRYLAPAYKGTLNVDWLPKDKKTSKGRNHELVQHNHTLTENLTLNVNAERVSDSTYFTDLSSSVQNTSKVHLDRLVEMNYYDKRWSAAARVHRFQTLQDASRSIVEPYHRVPQITFTRLAENFWDRGPNWTMNGEYSRFSQRQNTRVTGSRLYAYPSISWPHSLPYMDITPKIGLHMTRYYLDGATRDRTDGYGTVQGGGFQDGGLTVPIFSLNSSVYFDRETRLMSQDFTQTLEPRAYYVFIPRRDQLHIPNFDSGVSDVSLDQIFTENRYSSVDRVNEANQLTLAVTSRFIQAEPNLERLQLTLGRRFYFSSQYVTIPGEARRTSNRSDILAVASGQVTSKLSVTSGLQYSEKPHQLTKFVAGGAWRDGPGRAINLDYRFQKGSIKQVDASLQWPLMPKWYALGRLNYLIKEHRMAEGMAGLEYNAGCWTVRGVVHRLVTSATQTSDTFFIQLELNGLTKLGPNPLEVLKRSISGYVKSDEIDLLP